MSDRYQLTKADGSPDWTQGQRTFAGIWDITFDHLRFHRGAGFTIKMGHDAEGPVRKLEDLRSHLEPRMASADADVVFRVIAKVDGYALLLRRHVVSVGLGQQVIDAAAALKDTPYHLGTTDCSWLSGTCVEQVSGIVLPHHAASQKTDPNVTLIPRAKLIPGDLIFVREEHVAIWKGMDPAYPGGPVVWDTEPSDTVSPPGWQNRMLGTGVQVRPAFGGWYCAYFDASGRIPAINGAP